MTAPSPELDDFLVASGYLDPGEDSLWTPLAGGVSSDIWKVETPRASICVKRALAQLKVTADWSVPVERNAFEWAYMEVVAAIAPGSVPQPLAHDPGRGLFAMTWLESETHKLWKTELLAGRVDVNAAAAIGDLLGRIHARTATDPTAPDRFATDDNFHAIRIEPYLLTTADKNPGIANTLREIAQLTAGTRLALVHGDVSPKNILLGPDGPVLLDAECAWFGDPAFDVAFCLNHLAVKARIVPGARARLLESYDAFWAAYKARIGWEPPASLERRAAQLLPALALARVDGKSPLEYLDADHAESLRNAAIAALKASPETVDYARAVLTTS